MIASLKQKIRQKGKTIHLCLSLNGIKIVVSSADKAMLWGLSKESNHGVRILNVVLTDDVDAVLDKATEQIRLKRDDTLNWVKHNLLDDGKDVTNRSLFEHTAAMLANAIQVFVNREILTSEGAC